MKINEIITIASDVSSIYAYGTSEGAEKAWDTRGRGIKIYGGDKHPATAKALQSLLARLPSAHRKALDEGGHQFYLIRSVSNPKHLLAGGYTEHFEDRPNRTFIADHIGNNMVIGRALQREIIAHELGHAWEYDKASKADLDGWDDRNLAIRSSLSERAGDGVREHLAEAYRVYLTKPDRLKAKEPASYEFMQRMFGK